MECLRPSGPAVHTTEYDVHDSAKIVDLGAVVLYRRAELAGLARELRRRGHQPEWNFCLPSDDRRDRHQDAEPYADMRLRIKLGPNRGDVLRAHHPEGRVTSSVARFPRF